MVHEFPGRFDGKVVAITGGASGMGAAMTRRYIAEGAKVVVADFCDKAKGVEFVSQFPKDRIFYHHCDIGDPLEATSVVAETIKKFGDIDIVHNNAGTGSLGNVTELDPQEWARVFRVNLDAPFYISRAAITEMKRHTEKKIRGVIINTVSTAGVLGDPRLACYSASKAGLANLTRAMAADHARDGIRVNAVAPGFTRTGMSTALVDDPELYQEYVSTFPMGRIGEAEELAAAMMFLASDDASFIAGVGGYRLANQFQYNCCELGFGYHKLTYQPVLNVDGGLLSVSGLPELNANPGVIHSKIK